VLAGEVVRAERCRQSLPPVVIGPRWVSDRIVDSGVPHRSRVLDLSRPDLMRRAGYKNIAKGLRRLDELLAGDLDKTRGLIRALPAALDVRGTRLLTKNDDRPFVLLIKHLTPRPFAKCP
jgi:hypothetical protein